MASGLNTEYQMTLSFYNEFGDYNVWAKQYDTERKLLFEFDEDGIIPEDTGNFFAYLRGTFADGSLMPILAVDEVTEDTLLFKLTSAFLAVPGRAKVEIVLADNSDVEDPIEIDEEGNLVVPENTRILSTHSFYIKIEEIAVDGSKLSEHDEDILSEWTKIIVAVQKNEEDREEAEDVRRMNEERRQMNEYGGDVKDKDGNVIEHLDPEESRTHKELGYIARARAWAIGPSDTDEYGGMEYPGMGTDEYNARSQALLAQGYAEMTLNKTEAIFLQINNEDGHLYMYKAGEQNTISFRITDDHKGLEAIIS